MSWRLGLVGLLVATACVSPARNQCGNGLECPVGTVCDLAHEGCAEPGQVTACEDLSDGAACQFSGNSGQCDQGVCLGATCGDGRITIGEACDDGNNQSGDGCSADCLSSETCGNGIIDADLGEVCDCGTVTIASGCQALNSDEAGSSCRSNCTPHCGDGLVNAAEECDQTPPGGGCLRFGFDRGPLGCSGSCATEFAACADFGFKEVSSPGIATTAIADLWVADTGEIVAVGQSHRGVLGTAGLWQTETDLSLRFVAVDGLSSSYVVSVSHNLGAGSSQGGLSVFDGSSWSFLMAVPSAGDDTVPIDLLVEGAGEFVVAGQVSADGPVEDATDGWIMEYDGTWSTVLSFDGKRPLAVDRLGSGGDLIAVGEQGLVAFRRDGTWSEETVAGDPSLSDVYVASPDAVYAVGRNGVYFYDGASWVELELPGISTEDLAAVAGRSATEVYVFGGQGRAATFDGETWFPSATGTEETIASATASAGRVLVGAGNFRVYEQLPGGWGRLFFGEDGPHLLSGMGSSLFFTAGNQLWTYSGELPTLLDTLLLRGPVLVAAATETRVYAAQGARLVRHDVGSGTTELDNLGTEIAALWAPSSSEVWVGLRSGRMLLVGEGGSIASSAVVADGGSFTDIHGRGPDALAVTDTGAIYRLQSGEWSLELDTGTALFAVWLGPDGTAFAAGESGSLWRYDGQAWLPQTVATDERILAIDGSSAGDVFAVTVSTLQHFDGSRWSPVRNDRVLLGVAASAGNVFFTTGSGFLARLSRPTAW